MDAGRRDSRPIHHRTMNRFRTPQPAVVDEIYATLAELERAGSTLSFEEDEARLASVAASLMRGIAALRTYAAATGDGDTDLPQLQHFFEGVRAALLEPRGHSFFEEIAVRAEATWPSDVQALGEDGDLIYRRHADHGVLYGHPALFDGFVYLWHRDPRIARDHVYVRTAQLPLT